MAITITDAARRELEEYLDGEASFLRITVKPGGCSGMTYDAAIDANLSESDEVVFESRGVRIVADDCSKYFLGGWRTRIPKSLPGFSGSSRISSVPCRATSARPWPSWSSIGC